MSTQTPAPAAVKNAPGKPGVTLSQISQQSLPRRVVMAFAQTEVAVTAVAIVIFVFFSVAADDFFSSSTIIEVMRSSSYVGIVAAAWTLLLIVGELDLSPGALYALLMIVNARLINETGLGMWGSFVLLIVIGGLIGALQGLIVTSFGVPSFIVTLGTLSLFQGIGLAVSGSLPVAVDTDLGSTFAQYGGGTVGAMPVVVLWMVAVVLICGGILQFTTLGYHLYATGGSEKAAQQAGINTAVVKISAFALVGAAVAVSAALTVGQLGSASPVPSGTFNLTVIAAVIIGGVALQGGAGRVYGAFVGSLILGMVETGIILMGASSDLHYVVSGGILVVAGLTYSVLRGSIPRAGLLAQLQTLLSKFKTRPST